MSDWLVSSADGVVTARNGRLVLRAEGIRNQRTGKHATITVSIDGHDLAGDLFNYERLSERERLGRKAWAELALEEQREYPVSFLNDAIWRFSLRIWQEHVKVSGVEEAGADDEPPPPTFVLAPYIIEGGGTILFAPPGAGKSYTDYLMAMSIEHGCQEMWPCSQRRVLHINLERSPESVNRRIYYLAASLGLPATAKLRTIHARGKRLEAIYDRVANAVQADGYQFLSVDSIVRAGYGKLTDDDTGNAIIDVLNSLCPTWLAIGGSPRADSDHAFGSVMFDYGEDIGIKLSSQRHRTLSSLGVALEVKKVNDGAYPPMEILAYDFDGYHLAGVRKATRTEFPELAAGKQVSLADEVYDLLNDAGTLTATEIASELGRNRSNVASLLSGDTRFVRVKREGKSVYYGLRFKEEGV